MPLVDDNLSIWKISFRWAGLNPDALKYRFYIPLTVKDNMRLLLNAIISNSLFCRGLQPKLLLQESNYRDAINITKLHDVISGNKYDRNLMQHYYVWRVDFAHWCNRSGMPFPEFWFPSGWTVHELNHLDMLIHENPELKDAFLISITKDQALKQISGKRSLTEVDVWNPAITAAQTIWSEKKSLPIAEVVRMIKTMNHLKASAFTESAIRKRIATFSPTPGKAGRKPSKN